MLFSSPLLTVSLTVLTATLLPTVSAHVRLFAISVNGMDQGVGCNELNGSKDYIRCPGNDNPILDMKSEHLACNTKGAEEVKEWIKVTGGDKITFHWGHNKRSQDKPDDMIIDKSHLGPLMVYVSPDPAGAVKRGKTWSKIHQTAGEGDKWAMISLIESKGLHWIELPQLPKGKYLLRPELLALHSAFRDAKHEPEPQFYMSCVQIEVEKDSKKGLKLKDNAEKVAFPGAYPTEKAGWAAAGLEFSVYQKTVKDYKIPGPALAVDNLPAGFGHAPKRRRV
ncbi:hypothetical protein EX30DRAFT_395134 [Ascodesmis nigricans]|uniref:AA9 family lytic polysaccharide monooxygenase n=1 Tax=Ascodesmis nigricans TaxID=341454 RepID=A0A4S2MZP6_9PEZI|nr:hypothetical protein EX30DRAFT_395134 [Ascodesmis nigricans]